MAAPTYEVYLSLHGISIKEEDWPRLSAAADDYVSWLERTYTVAMPEQNSRSKAICAIADQMYAYEVVANSQLAVDADGNVSGSVSVSIGSVTTSVKQPNPQAMGMDMSESGQQKQLYRIAQRYLDIYRGVPGRKGRCCGY